MRLLVSVRDEDEAAAAVAGGADIVDVKNPVEGVLGAQPPHVIRAVVRAVPSGVPISASIGDVPALPGTVALAGLGAAACGVRFIKVGLLGARSPEDAVPLLHALRRSVSAASPEIGLVACAYADADRTGSLDPLLLPQVAAPFVEGCLIDTAVKDGRGLFGWLSDAAITLFIARCHDRGLFAALAGSLTLDELPRAQACGADIAGVRTAACAGGRQGSVSAEKVRALKARLEVGSARCHPGPDRLSTG
jgi:uncharacterized protein (UPF0264 family)